MGEHPAVVASVPHMNNCFIARFKKPFPSEVLAEIVTINLREFFFW